MSAVKLDSGFPMDDRFRDFTKGEVKYASAVAFIAWTLSVYDYTLFGTILPLISKSFGWSAAETGAVTTWVSVGVFVVAMLVGPIVDRYGRKVALVICCFGAALSSLLAGFATGALFLILVRALSGFGYSEQAVNSTYLNELYASKNRGLLYAFVQGGWPVGVLFGAAVTALMASKYGWREMFWFATFPAVVIAILAIWLRESPTYAKLKHVQALLKSGQTDLAQKLGSDEGIEVHRLGRSTYAQLFEPDLRRQTITLMASFLLNWCCVVVFVILGTSIMTESLHVKFESSLLILIVSNVATFVGYVLLGYVGDRIGRRTTVTGSWVASGIVFAIMLYGPGGFGATIVLYTLGLVLLLGPYSALYTYMSECFPARVRGTGVSLVNAMGPVGAILGAALYTIVLDSGLTIKTAAFLAGSVTIILAGLLLLAARNIKPGQDLRALGG